MWPELVKLILTRVLSLLQLIEIDSGPDKKFRQGFIGAPDKAESKESKQEVSLLALYPREASFFLT